MPRRLGGALSRSARLWPVPHRWWPPLLRLPLRWRRRLPGAGSPPPALSPAPSSAEDRDEPRGGYALPLAIGYLLAPGLAYLAGEGVSALTHSDALTALAGGARFPRPSPALSSRPGSSPSSLTPSTTRAKPLGSTASSSAGRVARLRPARGGGARAEQPRLHGRCRLLRCAVLGHVAAGSRFARACGAVTAAQAVADPGDASRSAGQPTAAVPRCSSSAPPCCRPGSGMAELGAAPLRDPCNYPSGDRPRAPADRAGCTRRSRSRPRRSTIAGSARS